MANAKHSCLGTVQGAVTCAPCLFRKTAQIPTNKPATKAVTEAGFHEALSQYLAAFSSNAVFA